MTHMHRPCLAAHLGSEALSSAQSRRQFICVLHVGSRRSSRRRDMQRAMTAREQAGWAGGWGGLGANLRMDEGSGGQVRFELQPPHVSEAVRPCDIPQPRRCRFAGACTECPVLLSVRQEQTVSAAVLSMRRRSCDEIGRSHNSTHLQSQCAPNGRVSCSLRQLKR